jgi:hypothetical protein
MTGGCPPRTMRADSSGSAIMARYTFLLAVLTTSIAGLAPAIAQQPPRPCAAIRQVCLQAGFVLNGARVGEGLFIHCINPIMQGRAQPTRATKPLPGVDPALIEACRARNPKFGMRDAQAPQPMGPRNRPPQAAPGTAPQDAPPQDEPDEPPQEQPAPKL